MSNSLPMPNSQFITPALPCRRGASRFEFGPFRSKVESRSIAMKIVRIISISILFVVLLSAVPLPAHDVPKDYQEVLTILGRSGDYKANILKVNVPRSDLHVSVSGVATPTPFGFGGWVALT